MASLPLVPHPEREMHSIAQASLAEKKDLCHRCPQEVKTDPKSCAFCVTRRRERNDLCNRCRQRVEYRAKCLNEQKIDGDILAMRKTAEVVKRYLSILDSPLAPRIADTLPYLLMLHQTEGTYLGTKGNTCWNVSEVSLRKLMAGCFPKSFTSEAVAKLKRPQLCEELRKIVSDKEQMIQSAKKLPTAPNATLAEQGRAGQRHLAVPPGLGSLGSPAIGAVPGLPLSGLPFSGLPALPALPTEGRLGGATGLTGLAGLVGHQSGARAGVSAARAPAPAPAPVQVGLPGISHDWVAISDNSTITPVCSMTNGASNGGRGHVSYVHNVNAGAGHAAATMASSSSNSSSNSNFRGNARSARSAWVAPPPVQPSRAVQFMVKHERTLTPRPCSLNAGETVRAVMALSADLQGTSNARHLGNGTHTTWGVSGAMGPYGPVRGTANPNPNPNTNINANTVDLQQLLAKACVAGKIDPRLMIAWQSGLNAQSQQREAAMQYSNNKTKSNNY